MKKEIKIEINDGTVYWSDGTPLGECEQCDDETAYHYDEDGKALCSDCLIMNHLDGKYG
jgi:hypothetical protein